MTNIIKEGYTSIDGLMEPVQILGTRTKRKWFGLVKEEQTLVAYEFAGEWQVRTCWVPSNTVKKIDV